LGQARNPTDRAPISAGRRVGWGGTRIG